MARTVDGQGKKPFPARDGSLVDQPPAVVDTGSALCSSDENPSRQLRALTGFLVLLHGAGGRQHGSDCTKVRH